MAREPITNAQIAGSFPWCIAGGYAACPSLAEDIDVWVFIDHDGNVGDDPQDVRLEILGALRLFGINYVEEENDPLKPFDFYDLGAGILCWKVAKLADGRQVILTNAADIPTLLTNFDVSTHQVALTSEFEVIKGEKWTPITGPPVQLRQGTISAARMKKIEERYSRKLSHDDYIDQIIDPPGKGSRNGW